MEEPTLFVISLAMFIGCYLAGCLPLFFNLTERAKRLANIIGAGLLIGTAICVIIPEGINTLKVCNPAESTFKIEIENQGTKQLKLLNSSNKQLPTIYTIKQESKPMKLPDALSKRDISKKENSGKMAVNTRKRRHGPEPAKCEMVPIKHSSNTIGISLLTGFLFMFIIDQLTKRSQTMSRNRGSVPTFGLVIHAAADGIAMGSASTSDEFEMQMLVFVAIMLHKAPAALALVSLLMFEGVDKSRIRKHLLIFSLAAPLATIFTFFTLQHTVESEPLSTAYYTGVIILFSGGTFLFIAAVHVLPELNDTKCRSTPSSSRSGDYSLLDSEGNPRTPVYLSILEIFLFCASALIPLLISFTHDD